MNIRLMIFMMVVFLGGCSAAVKTPLLDVNLSSGSRFLGINSGVRVVFPHKQQVVPSLEQRYGPEWRNIQQSYPEYRFN